MNYIRMMSHTFTKGNADKQEIKEFLPALPRHITIGLLMRRIEVVYDDGGNDSGWKHDFQFGILG